MDVIVDSHVHVGTWKYPSLAQYRPDMAAAGVTHAVLVQFVGNADNRYLADCVATAPGTFAGIAMVESDTPGAAGHVRRLAASGRFVGVRLAAATRSPGADPLALWRAIAECGLVASVRGPLSDIVDPGFVRILTELPDLRVRLEHLGFARYPELAVDRTAFDALLALARHRQVHLMWAGFYANSADEHPHPDADPYLREVVAVYGARRICWGGDWNRPDPAPHHYHDAISHVREQDWLSPEDVSWILGRTAAELFGWPADPDLAAAGEAVP